MNILNNSQLKIYLLCCFVSLGGFMYGYDNGVISTVLVMTNFQLDYGFTDDSIASYAIVPVSSAASCIAAFGAGFVADSLGRRKLLFIASIIHEVGSIMEIVGHTKAVFFAGRIISGLGVGVYSMLVPLYQSEIAKPENRGRLITMYQIFVTLGFCMAFWLGFGTFRMKSELSYQIPIGVQSVVGFILLAGAYFIPESPRWLIYKDRNTEAFKILTRLRGKNDVEVLMEYTGIVQDVTFDKKAYKQPFKSLLRKGTDNNRRRTFLGMGVHLFSQFTGINAILFYLPHILESAGITEVYSALLGNCAGGAVNFIATLFVVLYIDKWNRRFILMYGAIAMSICMVAISIISAIFDRQLIENVNVYGANAKPPDGLASNNVASYAILVMLCVFIAFFALSWGPIGWIYPAEIYPQMIRANALGVTTASSYLFNLFVSLISPIMFEDIKWGTYLFFGTMCLIMAVVVRKYYPETRGRSLEEVQLIFSGALIDQRPDAHHPTTAAEALLHLEQIQNNEKQEEYQTMFEKHVNHSKTLNHRNSSGSMHNYSSSMIELTAVRLSYSQ